MEFAILSAGMRPDCVMRFSGTHVSSKKCISNGVEVPNWHLQIIEPGELTLNHIGPVGGDGQGAWGDAGVGVHQELLAVKDFIFAIAS